MCLCMYLGVGSVRCAMSPSCEGVPCSVHFCLVYVCLLSLVVNCCVCCINMARSCSASRVQHHTTPSPQALTSSQTHKHSHIHNSPQAYTHHLKHINTHTGPRHRLTHHPTHRHTHTDSHLTSHTHIISNT